MSEPAAWPPCPCGRSWAVAEAYAPALRAALEALVAAHGEEVSVTVAGRSWLVPRRCIAYHGVTGPQLLSGRSGFLELTRPS